MEEKSFLDRMLGHLRETCKYSTGYPKDLGPSRVIHFTSEREFVQLLHQGYPVVVAFTIRGNYTKHLDQVLEAANQGRFAGPNITKYSAKALPFNYDLSAYGFREFFKRYGIQSSQEPK